MKNRDYKMPFGKFRGLTLEKIYSIDREYLVWAFNYLNREDLRDRIALLLEEMEGKKLNAK